MGSVLTSPRFVRGFLPGLGVAALGILAGGIIGTGEDLFIKLLIGGVLLLLLLLVRTVDLLVLCVLTAVIVNAQLLGVPTVARDGLLAVALVACSIRLVHQRRQKPLASAGWLWLLMMMGVLLVAQLIQGSLTEISILRTISMLLVIGLVGILARVLEASEIRMLWKGIFGAMLLFLIGGTLLRAIVVPSALFLAGDVSSGFSGPTANPNAMGLLAGAGVVAVALGSKLVPYRPFLLALLGAMTIASFSRAAVVGVVAAVALSHSRSRRVSVAVVAGLLIVSVFSSANLGLDVVREESRYRAWRVALGDTGLLSGVGFGATDQVYEEGGLAGLPADFQSKNLAGSYVQIIFELGILPGISFLILVALLLRMVLRRGAYGPRYLVRALQAVVIFGLVSAAVETWMFSSGSIFSLIFWLVVSSLLSLRFGRRERTTG